MKGFYSENANEKVRGKDVSDAELEYWDHV